jgi:hypothetical protein
LKQRGKDKTTQRKPSGARGKETIGAAIAPKGNYKRRRKELSNIDTKHTMVE